MGEKNYIFMVLIAVSSLLKGQAIKQNLLLANALTFHHNIYTYGYEQSKANLVFKCYAYNYQLKLQDSVLYDLGKHTTADYLEISVDTLHDVLELLLSIGKPKKPGEFIKSKRHFSKNGLCRKL
jgi:hypothetical protein